MKTFYPFQVDGVEFLSKNKHALLADEMGLGKTIQAIGALNKIKARKILIVCPASLKYNWKRELETWLDWKAEIDVVNGSQHRVSKKADIVIVNYDLLHRPNIYSQICANVFAAGVFDEAHYLKNRTAKRTQAVLVRGGVASRAMYKWFMTGTPVLNRPVELYPILKAVAPHVIHPYDHFSAFAKRWCGAYFDGFQMVCDGASNIQELNERLTQSGFMLRRMKIDVLKDLPDRTFQILPIDIDSGRLPAKFMTWGKSDTQKVVLCNTDGAELAAFRHELAKEKLKYVEAHIEETLEEKQKLVVFAYHRDIIDALLKRFSGFNPAVIHGNIPAIKRTAEVARFQTDPSCRLFIGQITAAGTGITLTSADVAVFAEISWVPGEIFQAADRLHRIGQKENVLIQFLVAEGTVEEYMLRTVIEKKHTIEQIIEERKEAIFQ